MAYYANHSSKRQFMATGGTIGEGNPTFDFSQAVIVRTENYFMILGRASVSDVVIKTYENQGQLPPDVSAVRPQLYQLRINRKDWEDKYKDKVNKKPATPLDLFLAERLDTFAHDPEVFQSASDDDFLTMCTGLKIDLGANALTWLNNLTDGSMGDQALTEKQISGIEKKIIDFTEVLTTSITLQGIKDHLALVMNTNSGSTGNSNSFGGSNNYAKVNVTEQKLNTLKAILHSELCDPKITPTPADVKLTQIATDLTMMEAKKLEQFKDLLNFIFQ